MTIGARTRSSTLGGRRFACLVVSFFTVAIDINDVTGAIENDQLIPCFQPVIELHTGRLAGFEVLARWKHPDLGLVLPANFISLAEESGMIGPLMQQIMRKAFHSAQQLPEPLILAVNVSPTQLRDLSLADQVRQLSDEGSFPLKRLTIEITESALLSDFARAQDVVSELKSAGCRIALDDFGTGYSSLKHLQALPFDELKVDQSFVATLTESRESRKIVAAIIGLGHSLGLVTVAEGIETQDQAEIVLCLGCELGQGWLYGRPVTADKLAGIVARPLRTILDSLPRPDVKYEVSSLEALPTQRLAQLQAIYDGAPVGLCFLDRNLRYVSLNRTLADMVGSRVAAHLGRTVKSMIPDLYSRIEPYLMRALQGEAIRDVEFSWAPNQQGRPARTDLSSFQPAFDESGEVIGISISVADITGLRRAEDALRDSEDHLRHISELNPEIPWVMDPLGKNLDLSPRWVPASPPGHDGRQHLGWLDSIHPAEEDLIIKRIERKLRTGEHIDIEYRIKNGSGGWKWVRSRGSPRFGPSGEIVRWYGSVEDIDARKQAEVASESSRGEHNVNIIL
jgi:PAS domain S-box-containing protein